MLLRITKHCSMGCPHCLGDFLPDGRHMAHETFLAALDFIRATQPLVVIITGGEPLEHPQAEQYILETVKLMGRQRVIVCTNGENLDTGLAARLGCGIQVVNDPRYYPRPVAPVTAGNVSFFDKIPAPIYLVGRALKNNIPGGRLSPSCFNIRSIVRHSNQDLPTAVSLLETQGKFCAPVIDWDGTIVMGETACCKPVGTVRDSLDDLSSAIRNATCRECGLDRNLPEVYRQVVWDCELLNGGKK